MERVQLNVRLEAEMVKRIDRKRVALMAVLGSIPSRSEVLRLALDQFLGGMGPGEVALKRTKTAAKVKPGNTTTRRKA